MESESPAPAVPAIDYERLDADVLSSVVSIYGPARRKTDGTGSGFVFDDDGDRGRSVPIG